MELRVSVCCRDPVVGLVGGGAAIGHSCDPKRLRQWLGRQGSACGTSDVTLGPTGGVLSHRLGSRPQHALDQSRGREWALLSDLPHTHHTGERA